MRRDAGNYFKASRARRARVRMQGALDLGRLDHTSPAVAFMQAAQFDSPMSEESLFLARGDLGRVM